MKRILLLFLLLFALKGFSQNRFPVLKARGDSLMSLHRYADALTCYEQAERIGARKIFMTTLYTDMARCYDAVGRFSEERRCYERLSSIVPDRALNAVKMAEVQMRTGQYADVLQNLSDLTSDSRYDDERLTLMASAAFRLEKVKEAMAWLDSLAAIHADAKDEVYWNSLHNKACMLSHEGKHHEAAGIMKDVAAHYHADSPRRAVCLGNLAWTEAQIGDRSALTHIEEALQLMDRTVGKESHDYTILLRKKAEILLLLDGKEAALKPFKDFFESEKSYITAHFAFLTEQERRNFWKREQPLIAECYALEETDPDFLLDVAVFSKSVLYQANIDDRTDSRFSQVFTARGQQVRNALRPQSLAVEFVRYHHGDAVWYGALVASKEAATRFVPLFSCQELRDYGVMAKGRTQPLSYCLAYTDRTMKNALYADQQLYLKVWGKILEGHSGVEKVYFAPEGDFHLLAVEYLPHSASRPAFYRLSSTSVLTEERTGTSEKGLLLVGGVDYAAKDLEPSAAIPDRSGSRQMSEDHILPREQDGFKYLKGSKMEADSIVSMLDGSSSLYLSGRDATEQRLKAAVKQSGMMHLSTHGFCAEVSEPPANVLDKDSLVEDKSLLRCGIILAGANKYAQQRESNEAYEDGILTAREVSQLDLSGVDLAVMSACQTALGRTTEDGMAGMPQGLKKAGARTIVASLWHVDDAATNELMTRFYRHLQDVDHPCPQDALTRAQEELRTIKVEKVTDGYAFNPSTLGRRKVTRKSEKNYAEPFFWAPFIVIDGI